jgi:ABC-type branched-subunit amino acid transport system ATPase component
VLECHEVTKRFGGLRAVHKCSIDVREHAIVGLIGPNGAGKSTLFNIVAGVYHPSEGEVVFRGEKISNLPPWAVASLGVVRTFQTPHGLPQMTVMENMMAAPLGQSGESFWRGLILDRTVLSQERAHRAEAHRLLDSIGMLRRRNELVTNLSAGEARMVELVRQLMLHPAILLLDEPAAGINPALTEDLLGLLRRLRSDGATILAIDHNLGFIMELCDSIYVMHQGEIIANGTPDEIYANERVIEAYIGSAA